MQQQQLIATADLKTTSSSNPRLPFRQIIYAVLVFAWLLG